MADLYDTLGVAKDATKDVIKKAFRRKAQDTHPDKGGDPEAFHAIERAHRVLTNDEARERYDRTGDSATEPDNTDGAAATIIAAIVDRFLADDNAKFKNLVADIRKSIKDEISTAKHSIGEGKAFEKKAIDLQKRVKGKNAGLLTRMFDSKIRDARSAVQHLERHITIRERALEMVEDTDFDVEKMARQQDVFTQDYANMVNRALDEQARNNFIFGWDRAGR